MRVLNVQLRDFRTYARAEAHLGEGLTVVHGPNGAGKSNLLEALYFGCTGRSPRTRNERELVRFGAPATRVVVGLADAAETHELSVGFEPGQPKRMSCDGAPVERLLDVETRPLLSVFVPDRLAIETLAGSVVESRDDPEAAFAGQTLETPWDKFHVAYFASEALWTYLTSPFLYTYAGFESEEIEPWRENGEEWRRLKVTFPDYIASHTKTQITHFGPDGLMRRHDYTVDILGGATGLNYASDYRNIGGIIIPTKRRVYAYEGDYQLVKEPLLVAIDMGEITFVKDEYMQSVAHSS